MFAPFNLVEFHSKVYGILYTWTYTEFRGISRYWAVKNSAELHEIKSIPYKIPYSAGFQQSTSENTLVKKFLRWFKKSVYFLCYKMLLKKDIAKVDWNFQYLYWSAFCTKLSGHFEISLELLFTYFN